VHVSRELPNPSGYELLEEVRALAEGRLAPSAAEAERTGRFPRDIVTELAALGLLGLPYPVEYGGRAQPYTVFLQILEELARAWLTVAETVSVHSLATFPLAEYGTDNQKAMWLEDMTSGRSLGAFCLSEPTAGSDAAALATSAVLDHGTYLVNGTKAWITHAGQADVYNLMVRTGPAGPQGISCLLAAADTPGLVPGPQERKMALRASPVASIRLDNARIPSERLIGAEGQGFSIAMAALASGRLAIAACAVGLAQAALDLVLAYSGQRRQFDQPIRDFQGIGFMIADMAVGVDAGRHLYLAAARRRDSRREFRTQAAMAKVYCTDMAMRVTTDAVQVLGGVGYTEAFPAERYMREAKALQILEGTNQIQRLLISRDLAHPRSDGSASALMPTSTRRASERSEPISSPQGI
jgi:alkylation response protein AidB-like acyl-CoA dehydrogenase